MTSAASFEESADFPIEADLVRQDSSGEVSGVSPTGEVQGC